MDASTPTSTVSRLQASRRGRSMGRSHRSSAASRRSSPRDVHAAGVTQAAPLRIAVLDRDSGFLVVLGKRLERLEWQHDVLAGTISTDAVAAMGLDALVVDLASVGARRWDWLERLCGSPRGFAVIVCTGSSTVAERVQALRLGVDDWLGKPCHPEELIARVEAVVGHRRRPQPRNLEPVTVGEVEIRRDQYQAFVGGVSLGLTRREFQLMELLASARRSDVLEREFIYETLWGYDMVRNDRSVDVFVHKLRRKLKRASPDWDYIHTHFRLGYRFAPDCVEDSTRPSEAELEPGVPLAA
jgi:DNA-binding response OmpR family regulator